MFVNNKGRFFQGLNNEEENHQRGIQKISRGTDILEAYME